MDPARRTVTLMKTGKPEHKDVSRSALSLALCSLRLPCTAQFSTPCECVSVGGGGNFGDEGWWWLDRRAGRGGDSVCGD
jgi:hypothetical protein